MKQFKIALSNIDQMKKFVSVISEYPFRMNLCADGYKIDAKSIMGVFSINPSSPVILEAETDDTGDLEEKLSEFSAT